MIVFRGGEFWAAFCDDQREPGRGFGYAVRRQVEALLQKMLE
jgi:hypothetical protein